MRIFLAALLLAAQAFSQAPAAAVAKPAAEPVKVTGRVTSTTGPPVRRATMTLRGIIQFTGPVTSEAAIAAAAANVQSLSAETDNDGNFVFERLTPGRYTMIVQRTGYVNENRPFEVSAGQNVSGLAIQLKQLGVIAGRVMDEYGDPVPQSQITVSRRVYAKGRWQLQQVFQPNSPGQQAAGADGVFSISVEAGRYYVSAEPPRNAALDAALTGNQGPVEVYVTTFYPSIAMAANAVAVDVASGAEVRSIDIRLQRGKAFRVMGKAVAPGGAAAAGVVTMTPADGGNTLASATRNVSVLRQDGGFQFPRVTPGTYVLQMRPELSAAVGNALRNSATGANAAVDQSLAGRLIVTVGDRSVEDIVLPVGPPAAINGSIRTEAPPGNDTKQANTPPRSILTLMALDGASSLQEAQMDGAAFQFKSVGPGQYQLNFLALPPRTYIRSVRYASQDVTRKPIDVALGGSEKLEIVLAGDGADVSGAVRNEKDDALARVTVTLWQTSAPADGSLPFSLNATTGPAGNYRFGSVPPGDYRVAAWEELPQGFNANEAPEFRKQFDGRASSVNAGASSQQTLDLKVIPRAAIDDAISKLP